MLEKGRKLFGSCEESAKLIAKLNKYSESSDYVSRLGEQSLEVGDWTTDNHFMKFDFNVELGKASVYANEWTKMMNSLEQTNSAGLITHRAGSGWMSHFVYVGGNSIDDLYSTFDANSQTDAFQTFVKNVSSIRELRNVSLISPAKAYPSKR
jgi:virulence-associated protein VapD